MIRKRVFGSFACFFLAALALSFYSLKPQADETLPGTASRSIYSAYDTFGAGWETTLLLNNTTRAPIRVVPTVFSVDGEAVPLPAVRLEAHEHKRVDFNRWIKPLGRNFIRGSLRLRFESVPFGLGAILSSVNSEKGLIVESPLHSSLEFKSSQFEAVWFRPDEGARVGFTLLNITDRTVGAKVAITDDGGGILQSEFVSVGPHQTRFLALQENSDVKSGQVGGVSIRQDDLPGAIFASGLVLELANGFSYNIPFVDPAGFGDTKFEGAGILLGLQGNPGQEPLRFAGRLLLRNVSSKALKAKPLLQRGAVRSEIGAVSLRAGEAQLVSVPSGAAPQGDEPIGIEIPHTGKPGDLIAQWFSVSETGSFVVETPLRTPPPDERFGGSNPFLLSGDNTSVTFIKNSGTETSRIFALIHHARGEYTIGLKTIPPGQTLAIDIGMLRDRQVPDAGGVKLPPDLTQGQINWRWDDGPPIVGRTNVMSNSLAIASNRSCSTCLCRPTSLSGVTLFAQPGVIDAGQTSQMSVSHGWVGCDGFPTSEPGEVSRVEWFSSNSSIATVNSSGKVTGVSAGQVTIILREFVQVKEFVQTGEFTADGEPNGICTLTFPPFPVEAAKNIQVKPKITTISPERGLIGATTAVTIDGNGFGTNPTVQAGSGITVNVTSASNTQISANFVVANNASAGNHSVTVTAGGQQSESKNFFVQVPTSLLFMSANVLPDGPDPPSGCPGSANYGIMIDLRWRVLDQNSPSNPILSANMIPHENGTFSDGTPFESDIGPKAGYPTSAKFTASDGSFHDVPLGLCLSVPISEPGRTSTQNITIIVPGGTSYLVRSQTWTVKAPGAASFGHGTITNGFDVSASR